MKWNRLISGFDLGDCPKCGEPLHLWFETYKTSKWKRIARVTHTSTAKGECDHEKVRIRSEAEQRRAKETP